MLLLICTEGFSQNVGIGTNLPAGRLHIDMNGATTPYAILIDDDGNPLIRIRRLGISKAFLETRVDDFRIGTYATNNLGKLMLATNSQNRMTVDPVGNIGVGTEDPESKFQVTRGSDVSLTSNGYLMLGEASSTNIVADNNEIQARNDSAAATLYLQASGGFTQFGATNDNNIIVDGFNIQGRYNGGDNTLVLQGINGGKTRFGNGFDFANTKVHISTGLDAGVSSAQSGFLMIGLSNGQNVVFDNNEILARDNGVASTLFLARDGSKVQLGNGTEASGTKLHITSGNDVGLPDNLSGFLMMGSQAGTNMVLDNNEIQARNNAAAANLYLQNGGGNVYIGDAAPFNSSNRLGVNGNAVVTGALRIGNELTPAGYKLAVDGKMICTEVMVRLVANWPDFVFNKDHQLLPLQKLESYIQENKHLPGIPAAATIEKEGMQLGDMQKLQMQKIEELTLYMIDLNKQVQNLKSENELLQQKLNAKN